MDLYSCSTIYHFFREKEMSDIGELTEGIYYAMANTSGTERELYSKMQEYIRTRDRSYLRDIKNLYERMDYYSQQRVEQFYQLIKMHYGEDTYY